MGMDPVKDGEFCEVTIVLEGPVGAQALAAFKTLIDHAVTNAGLIIDTDYGDHNLRVRQTRFVIR